MPKGEKNMRFENFGKGKRLTDLLNLKVGEEKKDEGTKGKYISSEGEFAIEGISREEMEEARRKGKKELEDK